MKEWIIKFGDGTYYSEYASWKGVTLDKATSLTHKEATKLCNILNKPKIDMKGTVIKNAL